MKDSTSIPSNSQIQSIKKAATKSITKITNIFETSGVSAHFNDLVEFRNRTFTPLNTLVIFTTQVMSDDKSCQNAVAKASYQLNCSQNTGAYCKARQRLDGDDVEGAALMVGNATSAQRPVTWNFKGHRVIVPDGTTILMPDTAENQEEFPQHGNQKKWSGFPQVRLVALFCLFTGSVINYAYDAYRGKGTGEHSLFRQMMGNISNDDIIVADALYGSYWFMSESIARGAHVLVPMDGKRNVDFRKGKKLGSKDHIVEWRKPITKPEWMSEENYASYPDVIKVREFRCGGRTFFTILLDHKKYSKKELHELYLQRWNIEINLRCLKTIMKMEMLSCKTPEMIVTELAVHFLAYNIIRTIITESCDISNLKSSQVSFKNAMQNIREAFRLFHKDMTQEELYNVYERLFRSIANQRAATRPGRVEPREVKRRPKPFPRLQGHRKDARKKIMNEREKLKAA